jgi:methylated-DNA-protein-cysteine methyltransferase related protein
MWMKRLAKQGNAFQQRVLEIVRAIPRGRVLTYGQVALLTGTPRGARQVGRVLYYSGRKVPWQRVINRYGGLSTYKIGSGDEQRQLLEAEGVKFESEGTVDLNKYRWRPNRRTIEKLELPDEIAFRINAKLPFSK